MNNTKELPKAIIDAANKCRESVAELDKALWYPQNDTDEVKKLKDDIQALQLILVACFLCLFVSVVMHGVRSYVASLDDIRQSSITRLKEGNVRDNRDRMMESYNAQMVPMLEREVKDLKDDLKFERGMSSGNKLLYQACMNTK